MSPGKNIPELTGGCSACRAAAGCPPEPKGGVLMENRNQNQNEQNQQNNQKEQRNQKENRK